MGPLGSRHSRGPRQLRERGAGGLETSNGTSMLGGGPEGHGRELGAAVLKPAR